MKEINDIGILYIDRIPDELNSTIWYGSCEGLLLEAEEGSDSPIFRDACKQMVHAVTVDHALNAEGVYSPTVYIRMLAEQRQLMVIVPYRVDPDIKKFQGSNCIVQSNYHCDRPINRTELTELLLQKSRQFNSLLFADGYIESEDCIRGIYDDACRTILECYYKLMGRTRGRPHRMRGSLFPMEMFQEESEERSEEVQEKRATSTHIPFLYRQRPPALIDGFPGNRPCVVDSTDTIMVYRRVPHFNLEMEPSGLLKFKINKARKRENEGPWRQTVLIEDIFVNHDERRQGYGLLMMDRFAKVCPGMRARIILNQDEYEKIALIKRCTRNKFEVGFLITRKISISFNTDDLFPLESDLLKKIS